MDVHVYLVRPIELQRWDDAIFAAYPIEFIGGLYPKRPYLDDITPSDLADFLRLAGAIYLDGKEDISNGRAEAPNWRDKERHRAQLANIVKVASKLQLQLAQLEKPAADLMLAPLRDQITQLISSNPDQFCHEVGHYKSGETAPAFLLSEEHLLKSLRVIETLAQDARDALPKDRGGRPDHPGLKRWTETLHSYWTGRLGQKFGLTFGELGMSPAVRFFVEIMAPLDPIIDAATVYSVMRGLKTELLQRTRRSALHAKTLNQMQGVAAIQIG